jgi:hypothetical protein
MSTAEKSSLKIVKPGDSKEAPAEAVEVSEKDLEKAENQLRDRAKALRWEIEDNYWELGKCLWEVYDGVPGGYQAMMKGDGAKQAREALFQKWGFKSFEHYAESELGLRKRTAQNIRYAYYWFEVQEQLPEEVLTELKKVGRSRVYILSGFAKKDSVSLWIEKAKNSTFEELKKAITAARALKAGKNVDSEEVDQLSGPDENGGAPAPEQTHTVQTSLYDDQFKIYEAAVARAKGLSKSDKIGHNLVLICQDFLANNEFGDSPKKDVKGFLGKMERMIGLKLIAIDPATGAPKYGKEILWMLIKEKSRQDGSKKKASKAEKKPAEKEKKKPAAKKPAAKKPAAKKAAKKPAAEETTTEA